MSLTLFLPCLLTDEVCHDDAALFGDLFTLSPLSYDAQASYN